MKVIGLGMVTQAFKPSSQEAATDRSKFQASLVTARATWSTRLHLQTTTTEKQTKTTGRKLQSRL